MGANRGSGRFGPRARKKGFAARGICGRFAGGSAKPAQARFWRADQTMAVRSSAGIGWGRGSVPIVRPRATARAERTTVVDAADVRAVGAGMEGILVTVLMAVRDTPSGMLGNAIASIRRQTLRDFEFLIADDGSRQPDTLEELDQQAAADSRIRLVRGEARGLTPALN